MTPREKASELIVNYQLKCKSLNYEQAKQCSLISVDEIINLDDFSSEGRDYWEQVKQELELL